MTVDIPAGFAQLAMQHDSATVKGGRTVTLLGFDISAGDLPTCVTAAVAAWDTHMVPVLHDEFIFSGVKGVTATDTYEQTAVAMGARAGALPPPNVAYLLKKITNLRGRHGRGRCYLPGFLTAADITDSGTIDPTVNAGVLAGFASFGGDMLTAGFPGVILHRVGSGVVPTPITNVASEDLVATQRRRLR